MGYSRFPTKIKTNGPFSIEIFSWSRSTFQIIITSSFPPDARLVGLAICKWINEIFTSLQRTNCLPCFPIPNHDNRRTCNEWSMWTAYHSRTYEICWLDYPSPIGASMDMQWKFQRASLGRSWSVGQKEGRLVDASGSGDIEWEFPETLHQTTKVEGPSCDDLIAIRQ